MSFFDDDFKYRDGQQYDPMFCDGVRLFNDIANELQYGRQLDKIGELSQMDRMLYQEQDFFFVGTKVFKKVDPIEQALDGDWGTDIQDADKDVRDEWEQKLAALVDPNYEDAMDYIVDQPLEDCHVHPEIKQDTDHFKVVSIDFGSMTGDFVALGYTPPRDKYKFIGNFAPNRSMMAAHARETQYKYLLSDIKNASSLKELNHLIVEIREDYNHDKEIRTKWSEQSRTQERIKCERDMRGNDSDEETIRQRLWKEFDKTPGKFESKGKHFTSYGSKWHRQRSRAYQALRMTYSQWQRVYKEIDNRKAFFLTDFSEKLYRDLERSVNRCNTVKELQAVHELVSDRTNELNKAHKQRIWKIWGVKAKQKGLRGEKYYG